MSNEHFRLNLSLGRRDLLKASAGGVVALAAPAFIRGAYADGGTIKLGAPLHKTGIGAYYGRWYDRAATAAVQYINENGGINGRRVDLIVEDDGTDPKRGTELVEKFATDYKVDAIVGHLFGHVVAAAAPRAGELKTPYFICAESSMMAAGKLNRWVFQPGITDVRSQVQAMAPWMSNTIGKKVTMLIPDYSFGYEHRDFFSAAIKQQGGEVVAVIAIPPTESTFTRYMPQIPPSTEVIYHVMVGPAVLTFVKELGDYLGSQRPEIFGYIDSMEAVDLATPQLEFLEGTYFWEANPRYAQANQTEFDKTYREKVGLDQAGASLTDSKDISTYSHMFSIWETLFVIKQAMEMCNYQSADQKEDLVAAMESITEFPASLAHPQGAKLFDGKRHQAFGAQYISKVEGGKLNVVHTTSIEDGMYESDVDYTKMSL